MDQKQFEDTFQRFRLHGFGREQAIMMAEAIRFSLDNAEFAKNVGRFGIKHLQDAVASMMES